MKFSNYVLIIAFIPLGLAASFDRISEPSLDLLKVTQIYSSPGLVSVLQFPEPVIEVRIGDTSSLKAEISKVSINELTLGLGSSSSQPTNLIVRTLRKTYVFDVIPSRNQHQDLIKISRGSLINRGPREVSSGTIATDIETSKKQIKGKIKKSGRISL